MFPRGKFLVSSITLTNALYPLKCSEDTSRPWGCAIATRKADGSHGCRAPCGGHTLTGHNLPA